MLGLARKLKNIRWHSDRMRILVALLLAITVTCVVDISKQYLLNSEAEEVFLDDLMAVRQERGGQTVVPPMTFFNIDEMTHEAMQQQEPRALLSRRVIRKMLQGVLLHSPEVVMVDYDFGFHAENSAEDEDLVAFLRSAAGLNGEKQQAMTNPGKTPILLGWNPGAGPLDEIVAEASLLHWVGVRTIEDDDGLTRRISHWDIDCQAGNERIVPGVHWLTRALLQGKEGLVQEVQGNFANLLAEGRYACETLATADFLQSVDLKFPGEQYDMTVAGVDTRIQFLMGWGLEVESPLVEAHRPDGRIIKGPLLDNVIAYATVLADVPPPADFIEDRIVLIGSAYEATRDHFKTPLNTMPGTILLANAIKSFAEYGPLQRSSLWTKLMVVCLLTVIAFLYFRYCRRLSFYDPIIFKQIFLISSFVIWALLGYFMVGKGAWMDILFPQYVVTLYFAREDFVEMKERIEALTAYKSSQIQRQSLEDVA